MDREEIKKSILKILEEDFDIENPGEDKNLREEYDFDSIDAIDMLVAVEAFLASPLTVQEKKKAVNIRTLNHICDYVEELIKARN